MELKPAKYWMPYTEKPQYVQCRLCFHHCVIAPGKRGFCHVRENRSGVLYPVTYGKISAMAMDPIEKKPLYHFHPGREIFSIGSIGCNLACAFCQNYHISQNEAPLRPLSPEEAVSKAKDLNSVGIAFTYNEPLIWIEYVLDTARLAHEAGLKVVLVTNGLTDPEPLDELLPHFDAANVDIKSMDDEFYGRVCKGMLEPILRNVKVMLDAGKHVELTNLVIPEENDTNDDFEAMRDWIKTDFGPFVPVHVSAYFPSYKMLTEPTPPATLVRARKILSEDLHYVYIGNALVQGASDTFCAVCGATVIKRLGYSIDTLGMTNQGKCAACGADNRIVT